MLQLEAIALSPCSRYPSVGICGALEFDSTNEQLTHLLCSLYTYLSHHPALKEHTRPDLSRAVSQVKPCIGGPVQMHRPLTQGICPSKRKMGTSSRVLTWKMNELNGRKHP